MKACPSRNIKGTFLSRRIPRESFYRFLPGAQRYLCFKCDKKYIFFLREPI
jgi:hypothetical protein